MNEVTIAVERVASDYTAELFILGGIVVTAILGWIGTIIAKRMREPVRIETLWARLDAQDVKMTAQGESIQRLHEHVAASNRRNAASSRIIRDLARQWPGSTIPRLSPADIGELEENTLPSHWKRTT